MAYAQLKPQANQERVKLTIPTSDWEWALRYCGDPGSFEARSQAFLDFLVEEGMRRNDHLLDIGCGCLAPGAALIEYLAPTCYTGIEPFGLLVNVAMRHFPNLEHKNPRFLWRSDFDASETGITYDFVVSHSVLSHAAHHQLPQLLANVRKVVEEDAVFLCTYREDQFNSFAQAFQYPDITHFRLRTVMLAGAETGWKVERMPEYEKRLRSVAPNDTHEILRLTAVPTPAEANEQRLAEEARQRVEREAQAAAEEARVAALTEADRAGTAEVERA